MKITIQLLEKFCACQKQIDLFATTFPEGTIVTEKTCMIALEAGIDFDWACDKLLKYNYTYQAAIKSFWNDYQAAIKPLLDDYMIAVKPFLDDYQAAIKPFVDDYMIAVKPFWNDYMIAVKPFLDDYTIAVKPFWNDYQAVIKPFWNDYKKQQALLFCKQFEEENA